MKPWKKNDVEQRRQSMTTTSNRYSGLDNEYQLTNHVPSSKTIKLNWDIWMKPWIKASRSILFCSQPQEPVLLPGRCLIPTWCVEMTTLMPLSISSHIHCSLQVSVLSEPSRSRVWTDGICAAITFSCCAARATFGAKNQTS